jgi:hypothetical protein
LAVGDKVELGSWLAAVDRICAHMVPPRLARTLMVSTLARDQSSRPATPSRSSTSRWRASNTPARAHSSKRRQTVAGEPQPSSLAGSSRHGVEVRAMNTIAAKQLRSETVRRRPPYGGRGGVGKSGTTNCHSWSETSSSTRVAVMTANSVMPPDRSETPSNTTAALFGGVGVVASGNDERGLGDAAASLTRPVPHLDPRPAATPARPAADGSPTPSARSADRRVLRAHWPPVRATVPWGWRARMTARKAWASMARVICRYQASQRRTS